MSKVDFLAMCVAWVHVGYDYFTAKYITPGGELHDLKRAFKGAGVFAPKALAEMDPAALEALIDLLALFGFPEFTAEFLQGMKAELPEVIRHAKQPFDWARVKGAAEYDVALVRRKRTGAAAAAFPAAAAPPAAMTREKKFGKWEEDPMELARRIWDWWRARLCGVDLLKCWSKAARLVALVQTSSARMERAFSQL